MAIPVSTWALVAGVAASAALVFGRSMIHPDVPPALAWLSAWTALFVTQAASWSLSRSKKA